VLVDGEVMCYSNARLIGDVVVNTSANVSSTDASSLRSFVKMMSGETLDTVVTIQFAVTPMFEQALDLIFTCDNYLGSQYSVTESINSVDADNSATITFSLAADSTVSGSALPYLYYCDISVGTRNNKLYDSETGEVFSTSFTPDQFVCADQMIRMDINSIEYCYDMTDFGNLVTLNGLPLVVDDCGASTLVVGDSPYEVTFAMSGEFVNSENVNVYVECGGTTCGESSIDFSCDVLDSTEILDGTKVGTFNSSTSEFIYAFPPSSNDVNISLVGFSFKFDVYSGVSGSGISMVHSKSLTIGLGQSSYLVDSSSIGSSFSVDIVSAPVPVSDVVLMYECDLTDFVISTFVLTSSSQVTTMDVTLTNNLSDGTCGTVTAYCIPTVSYGDGVVYTSSTQFEDESALTVQLQYTSGDCATKTLAFAPRDTSVYKECTLTSGLNYCNPNTMPIKIIPLDGSDTSQHFDGISSFLIKNANSQSIELNQSIINSNNADSLYLQFIGDVETNRGAAFDYTSGLTISVS
ncbi:hypothetical protein ADUPG1_000567, partial [Aduncisulcus paluster]